MRACSRIKDLGHAPTRPACCAALDAFGGLFALGLACPTPFSSPAPTAWHQAQGAPFLAGVHDAIGQDLVNHYVNNVLVRARPAILATCLPPRAGWLPSCCVTIVKGVQVACRGAVWHSWVGDQRRCPSLFVPLAARRRGFMARFPLNVISRVVPVLNVGCPDRPTPSSVGSILRSLPRSPGLNILGLTVKSQGVAASRPWRRVADSAPFVPVGPCRRVDRVGNAGHGHARRWRDRDLPRTLPRALVPSPIVRAI